MFSFLNEQAISMIKYIIIFGLTGQLVSVNCILSVKIKIVPVIVEVLVVIEVPIVIKETLIYTYIHTYIHTYMYTVALLSLLYKNI